MAAIAPHEVNRGQYRASRITGPKAAPKPAHAKETSSSTEESGLRASRPATSATTSTPMRPSHRVNVGDPVRPRSM